MTGRVLEADFKGFWSKYVNRHSWGTVYDWLFLRYSEKHRFYHNLSHLQQCLFELDGIKKKPEHLWELEYAIWFHDVIYDPEKKDNEERSVEVAVLEAKRAGLSEDSQKRIAQYILATKHIDQPSCYEEELIIDIDLSILGASKKIFDEYDKNIRKEYSFVEKDAYKKGRSEILNYFLTRKDIYFTDFFRRKYKFRAKENLERAMERLESGKFI